MVFEFLELQGVLLIWRFAFVLCYYVSVRIQVHLAQIFLKEGLKGKLVGPESFNLYDFPVYCEGFLAMRTSSLVVLRSLLLIQKASLVAQMMSHSFGLLYDVMATVGLNFSE